MKKKQIIYFIILFIIITLLALLSFLGNKVRNGYFSEFKLQEKSGESFYRYDFRIKYNDKIFRNNDIYNVFPNTNNLPDYITALEFNKYGSPFGQISSREELKYESKIDNVSYTLKIKGLVYIYSLILLLILFVIFFYSYSNKKLIFVIAIITLFIRLHNIDRPIVADRHEFRQSQTAITIQEYFNEGYSLFNYRTPVLGEPYLITLEFPLYQSSVFFFMKFFSLTNIDVSARALSIFYFYLSALILYYFTKLLFNKKIAYNALIIYFISPFNIFWSRAVLIDYFSISLSMAYSLFFLYWLKEKKSIYIFLSILFGSLGGLSKITSMAPSAMIIGCFIIYELITDYKIYKKNIMEFLSVNLLKYIKIFSVCFIPLLISIIWIKYADYIKAQSVFTKALVGSSQEQINWNFGLLKDKLNPQVWFNMLKNYYRYYFSLLTPMLMALSLLAFYKRENRARLLLIFLSVFGSVFIFFNLYWVHDYYWIAISPFLSIILAVGIFYFMDSFDTDKISKSVIAVLISFYVIINTYSDSKVKEYMSLIFYNKNSIKNDNRVLLGNFLKDITKRGDKIFVLGYDWSSSILYQANQKGHMITTRFESMLPASYDSNTFIVASKSAMDNTNIYNNFFNERNLIKYINPTYEEPLGNYAGIYGNTLTIDKNASYMNIIDYSEKNMLEVHLSNNIFTLGTYGLDPFIVYNGIDSTVYAIKLSFEEIPLDDIYQVFYKNNSAYFFSEEKSIKFYVNKNIKEYFIFLYNKPIYVTDIRFDFGNYKNQFIKLNNITLYK